MARKKIINNSKLINSIDLINKKIEAERQSSQDEIDSFDIVKHAGGSINNLPVKTKEFGSWLAAHQSTNPFIGKHVTSAPEEYTEAIKLNDDEVLDEADTQEFINQSTLGAAEFDPNSSFGDEADDYKKAFKGDDTHDNKFIDLNIIENMTKKYLSLSGSMIEDKANIAMQTYHDDKFYETPINVSNIIKESKILFIEQKKQQNSNTAPLKLTSTKFNNGI